MRTGFRNLAGALGALASAAALWTVAHAPAQSQSSTADPAREAVRECPSARVAAERACYQEVLHERISAGGAGAALALLDRLATLDPDVRRDGHMYAHGIGIAALESPENVGTVFASCTPAWQSGCYHGVIQSYFLATRRSGEPVTTQTVDSLCAAWRGAGGDRWLLFQCTHGLGHGLTMFHAHDLRQALVSCDLLSRGEERDSCYGGAFMENIVNVTQPHHMPQGNDADSAGHQGHGAASHGGHDGHGSGAPAAHGAHGGHGDAPVPTAAEGPWRPLDRNDLHYPCSVVAPKYLDACYTIQTAAMLHFTGQDVRRTAEACGNAPERVRRRCFESLGRDVSTLARDPAHAVRLCGHAESRFEPACHEGVVQAIVNMNADPSAGITYCRGVTPPESKRACYSIVGRQAMVLTDGAEQREAACRAAEPAFVDVCLGQSGTPVEAAVVTASRR